MKRASLLDLVMFSTALVAAGCGDDTSPSPDFVSLTGSADGGVETPAPTTTTPPGPNVSVTPVVSSTPSPVGSPSAPTPSVTVSIPIGPPVNTGGAGGTPEMPSTAPSASGGSGGLGEIPDCDVVVSFDEAWGVVATGGGTSPADWETSVVPSIANGLFSVDVPFTSSAQQFGWNGDYPNGPIDCTGRELVARVRLSSGFVADPTNMPGGVLMYLFSNNWSNSLAVWNNVPAPSDNWFEATVGCAAATDSDFDPTLVNGIGFTFNSGGADATSYTATTAAFAVDQLCWRSTGEPMGTGGAGGQGGSDAGATTGSGETGPDGGVTTDTKDASVAPDAGDETTSSDAAVPDAGQSTATADDAGSSGTSTVIDAGTIPTCESLVDFNASWGVVATGGGTDPASWETSVHPTIANGLFSVTVPFSTAVQQYGWVGDIPGGTVDCTGWELVARVRLKSGFVENPQTMAGGVQVYLFSDSWGTGHNDWNVVPAPSNDWFEATVTCETAQGSDFDPTDVNGIGFTFNSGGDNPTDYTADPAAFDVDYLCWRK
ncbi:MAG TPA: hypothetical protein VHM70_08355 [Polyangiaceae bacterium]|nr:hypothetical protein [Polyangiaceae bacterium]